MLSLALLLCATSFAQIKTPAASPSAKLMQTVGLTDVEIEYSRPSAKGRTIFAADGLVPFGKVWRTGANAISKITFSDDVMVEGNKVPAGSYGILPELEHSKGSASRFFYCAKASAKDRQGSKHPTVKPIALMRYLCRLVTPYGGIVLDPFAGTGSTGQAALEEGFESILIEREENYINDSRRLRVYCN